MSKSPAASFAEPKPAELVPILTGEENFASWSAALKCALDTHDSQLFELLTGAYARPSDTEHTDLDKWNQKSHTLLPYLHAIVHSSIKLYINTAPNAFVAFQTLYKIFGVHKCNTGYDKFSRWTHTTYDGSTTPQEFVNQWRIAYSEFVEACGHYHISNSAQYFHFLTAVSENPDTHPWLHSLNPPASESSESLLISAFSDFVISENQRLTNPTGFGNHTHLYQ
ncbi:hypothetical protein N7457_000757 [Penicillium paradoxum]|uniref:uncharacterized protein n=1 Tax=Penicillium paradoxum TaxID=176176 RepID=UPI00254721EF|nr:uncharacterized protein N7457_000757 [Penicillium paradoxum]KAJ5794158.1 hypothetical protein N7457_000757 [Penicillium paradoxum]